MAARGGQGEAGQGGSRGEASANPCGTSQVSSTAGISPHIIHIVKHSIRRRVIATTAVTVTVTVTVTITVTIVIIITIARAARPDVQF